LIEQEGIYKEIYNIQMMRGDEIGVL